MHQSGEQHSTKHHHGTRHGGGDQSDEEERAARKTAEELANAKKERASLIKALSSARKAGARGGGDLQAADIAALRQSLAQKQRLLDELRERNAELEER